MNYYLNLRKLCLVVLLLSYLFPCCIWAADEKKDDAKKTNLGIAVIDTEKLFKTFVDDHNLMNKVMNDYNIVIKDNKFSPNLTPDQKQDRAQEELDKIAAHYCYQVLQVITLVINDLIKEHSLILVVNKKTFSMKNALISPERQRRDISDQRKKENMTKASRQVDSFFNQSILSSAYDCMDITDEAAIRIKNMNSQIKILSYGRSLK